MVFFQSLFGQAKALQQGSRVNTVIPKRDKGVSPRESGGRWQAGNPSVGHLHAPFAKPVEINCRLVPNQDVRTAGSSTKLACVAKSFLALIESAATAVLLCRRRLSLTADSRRNQPSGRSFPPQNWPTPGRFLALGAASIMVGRFYEGVDLPDFVQRHA